MQQKIQYQWSVFFKLIAIGFFYQIVKFILNTLIARYSSPSFYGDFRFAFSTLIFLAPLLIIGTSVTAKKFLSKYHGEAKTELVRGFVHWINRVYIKSMVLFVVGFVLLYMGIWVLHIYGIKNLNSYHLLVDMLVLAPMMSFLLITSSYLISIKNFLLASFLSKMMVFLTALVLMLILISVFDVRLIESHHILIVLLIAYSVTLLLAVIMLRKYRFVLIPKIDDKRILSVERVREWKNFSLKMIFNLFFLSIASVVEFYIIEFISIHGEANLGYYAAIATIASLFWVPSGVARMILTPYLSSDYNKANLQIILNKVNLFKFVVLIAVAVIIFLYGNYILFLFGPSYSKLYRPLCIMSVGYLIIHFFDVNSLYLQYSGYENFLTYSNLFKIILNIITISLAYYFFNLIGLVISMTSIRIVESVIFTWWVKQKTDLRLNLFF